MEHSFIHLLIWHYPSSSFLLSGTWHLGKNFKHSYRMVHTPRRPAAMSPVAGRQSTTQKSTKKRTKIDIKKYDVARANQAIFA